MGQPYARELSKLPQTYAWALKATPDLLPAMVDSFRGRGLLVVGSGGSLTACHLAAMLHEGSGGPIAKVLTPLEFLARPDGTDMAVLFVSASGRNKDILAAARHALRSEYGPLAAVCARTHSPLAGILASCARSHVVEFEPPAGKDGFLATNSLIATCVALATGYGGRLPSSLPRIHRPFRASAAILRPNLVIVTSGWATPAGFDMESKWSEAGFGSVSLCDPRNFAHGRHNGLARRATESGVIALCSPDDLAVAQRTLALLPAEIPKATYQTKSRGAAGAIDLITGVIQLAGHVAAIQAIDPGQPRVPPFGRALFRAGIPRDVRPSSAAGPDLWLRRKLTPAVWESAIPRARARWRAECHRWLDTLAEARIGGLVVDYDGTLCETTERLSGPRAAVGNALSRLLRGGLPVGIASGRGKSLVTDLRTLLPMALWPRVTLGLYNGAVVLTLDGDLPKSLPESVHIRAAAAALLRTPTLSAIATLSVRGTQVTIVPKRALPPGFVVSVVSAALQDASLLAQVVVVSSGHSVDVVPREVSKEVVVAVMQRSILGARRVLRIGDQGSPPGNDATFLASPYGLSVDRCSTSLRGCWNIAPAGERGTAALLRYLRALTRLERGCYAFDTAQLLVTRRGDPTAAAGSRRVLR